MRPISTLFYHPPFPLFLSFFSPSFLPLLLFLTLLSPGWGGRHLLYVGGYPVTPTRVFFERVVRREGSILSLKSVDKGIL